MATSLKHARRMMTCYRTLDHWCAGRTDVYIAIDLLVYYERGNNVRRAKALRSSGCESRPATFSFQPVAIGAVRGGNEMD